jgi:hypothetical protein
MDVGQAIRLVAQVPPEADKIQPRLSRDAQVTPEADKIPPRLSRDAQVTPEVHKVCFPKLHSHTPAFKLTLTRSLTHSLTHSQTHSCWKRTYFDLSILSNPGLYVPDNGIPVPRMDIEFPSIRSI